MQSCGGCGTAQREGVQLCGAGDVAGGYGSPSPSYLHCCRDSAAHSRHPGSTACHLPRATPGDPSNMSVCASGCMPGCYTAETLQLVCVWPHELAIPSESSGRYLPCIFRAVSLCISPLAPPQKGGGTFALPVATSSVMDHTGTSVWSITDALSLHLD